MTELISVAILTYNRKNILRESLKNLYTQEYKNLEIIVVDNASNDGTLEMLSSEFPQILQIKNKINTGASAINSAFNIAKGQFILILDDDSYPEFNTINIAIKHFENSEIGVVALNIFNKYLNVNETKYFTKYPLSFIGCGAIVRKKILVELNGYDPNIFIYQNELDLSLNILNNNYKIIYEPNGMVIHNFIKENHNTKSNLSAYKYKNFFVSTFYVIMKNTSGFVKFKLLIIWFLNRTLILSKFYYFKEYIWALKISIKKYKITNQHYAVNKNIQKKLFSSIKIIDRDYFANQISIIKKYLGKYDLA